MTDLWTNLMGNDEETAAAYMDAYGEGPGSETRNIIGSMIRLNQTVLDVGCGPGWNYDHFLKSGPIVGEYKGIDLSPLFVKVANKRHPGKFEIGDCRDVKEDDQSWDVVILQDILEHTNGYEKTVDEGLRVARNKVIVTFWRMKHGIVSKTNDDRDKGDDGYGSEYDQGEWEHYLDDLKDDSQILYWHRKESPEDANRHHLLYELVK